MKILHLPTPVGGNAFGLSRGERFLKHQSDVLVLENTWLKYQVDRVVFDNPLNNPLKKFISIPKRLSLINELIEEYDVFHFNFGSTLIDHPNIFLPLFDLPRYKRAKKKIFVTYNGCDARQKYPTMRRSKIAACFDENCYGGMCNSGKLDRERRLKIKKFDQYADGIFALNPDLLYFLPERARFLPYSLSRWDEMETQPFILPDNKIHIVHAPTNRVVKGSDIIIDIIRQVQECYPEKIKLTLVEKKTHEEALCIYREADLIIDQILVGFYGGFAVECIKLGKPVMVYLREEDLKFMPEQMHKDCLEAFINVNQNTLFDKLCQIVENPEILESYYHAGLAYIHRWHDPKTVAKQTVQAYEL